MDANKDGSLTDVDLAGFFATADTDFGMLFLVLLIDPVLLVDVVTSLVMSLAVTIYQTYF